jgi:CubicO group peptidase (beta-lactamase class C family)
MLTIRHLLLVILLLSGNLFSTSPLDEKEVTTAIENARSQTGVPAIAVIVVDQNKVLYMHAFGLADLERDVPATPETPFYIASATKSFVGLTAAILAAEGKLDLDSPVSKTLPKLHLKPPLDTTRMSLRDFLTHRLGFKNSAIDLRTAWSGEINEATIWRLAEQDSEPSERVFDYDNLGYVFAGTAIGEAVGGTWKDAVQDRILKPMSMAATSPHPLPGAAKPYVFVDGHWQLAPEKSDETMHAAGGMFASIKDLGRWIRAQLTLGRIDGTQAIPSRPIREAQAPQIDMHGHFYSYERYAYGLGWYHSDYEGELLVHCFGGFTGSQAHLSFMPDRNIGVAVLTNTNGVFAHIVASYLYDVLLGKPDALRRLTSESKKLATEYASSEQRRRDQIKKGEAEVPPSVIALSHSLSWYEGTYTSQAYGDLKVEYSEGGLHIHYGVLTGPLVRLRGDEFLMELFPDSTDVVFFTGAESPNKLNWQGDEFTRK